MKERCLLQMQKNPKILWYLCMFFFYFLLYIFAFFWLLPEKQEAAVSPLLRCIYSSAGVSTN